MNDRAYTARCRVLIDHLLVNGSRQAVDLRSELGWSPDEIRGKLQSLRTDRKVVYLDGWWTAVPPVAEP